MAGTFTPDGLADPGSVSGQFRLMVGVLDGADGAGEAVATGLDYVAGFTVTPKSCATLANVQQFSKSGGNITPASCSSGDTWYAVVWGK